MTFRDYSNYEVYDDGKIWSYKKKKFLKPKTNNAGYQLVFLSNEKEKMKGYLVHRIVYETFSGEPIPEGMQVNHINEIKTDNRFENLNLMTPKENCNWGSGIARMAKAMTNNPKISKTVGAFKDGNLVLSFPSVMEAHRNGFDGSSITRCCNGERKTHRGYEWRYI